MYKIQRQSKKRSLFGRSLCSVRLFQSVVPPSIPQALQQHSKITALKKSPYFPAPFSFLIFTQSLPAFVGTTSSTIQPHLLRSVNYASRHSAILRLPSLIVSAVALSPSHWGWLRSVKKRLLALNQGTLR